MKPDELADLVILVGDPGRVSMVGEYLTDKEFERQSREFVSTTGKYRGKRITVLSTGIGTDNIDIVMTELDALANVDFKTRELKREHRASPSFASNHRAIRRTFPSDLRSFPIIPRAATAC